MQLEFQDEQMGVVGVSGTTWTIFPDGSCQANRFVNNTVLPSHQSGVVDQESRVQLSEVLSKQNLAALPAEIPSEPIVNPRRLTIRWGEASSSLVLQPGQSIEDAVIALQNQAETPRSRFLVIASMLNQLVQQNCGVR